MTYNNIFSDNNTIIKIDRFSYYILNITKLTIIATPLNKLSERCGYSWIRYLIEKNYPKYSAYVSSESFTTSRDIENLLKQLSQYHFGCHGHIYANNSMIAIVENVLPISIRVDDLEFVEIIFNYQQP